MAGVRGAKEVVHDILINGTRYVLADTDDQVVHYGIHGATDIALSKRMDHRFHGSASTKYMEIDSSADAVRFVEMTLVLGHSASVTVSDGDGATNLIPGVQILGTAKADSSLILGAFNATDDATVAPSINLLKSGHATIGSNTIVASGEVLGEVTAFGADGTDFESPAAQIQFLVDTTPGVGDMPGRIVFKTTADSGETLTEALRITSSQDVRVNNGGGLIVGSTSIQVTTSDGDGATNLVPEVQVLGTAKGDSSLLIASFSATATAAAAPALCLLKSAHATIGSSTILADNEIIGEILFFGSDGVDLESLGGRIHVEVDGSPAANQMPSAMVFGLSAANEAGAERMRLTNGPILFVGDTSDANITAGLCLNQGAADNVIISLKSSDVAHGVTDLLETDTYGAFRKYVAGNGGLEVLGVEDTGDTGLALTGVAVTANATRSTAGAAAIMLKGSLKSTTTVASIGADKNILSVSDNGTVRFILDTDGDSFQDVGTAWTNFDDFDDPKLLTALSVGVSKAGDPVREQFAAVLDEYRPQLEKAELVTFNDDGHHFVNMSRLTMVLTGAVRQLAGKLEETMARLTGAEQKLLAIGAA